MIDPVKVVQDKFRASFATNKPPVTEVVFDKLDLQWVVLDLVYDNLAVVNLPPVDLKTGTLKNGTNKEDTQTFLVDDETSDSFTWSLTEALSFSYEYSAKVPLVSESTFKMNLSLSSTQSQSTTHTRKWSYSAQIPVEPHSTVDASFLVQEGKISTPFKLLLQAKGQISVRFNLGPVTNKDSDWRVFAGDIDTLIKNGQMKADDVQVPLAGTFTGIAATNYHVETTQRNVAGQLQSKAALLRPQLA